MPGKLFHYGYGGTEREYLAPYLNGGNVLLDIRLSNRSRQSDWRGRNLASWCHDVGGIYAHAGGFGNENYRDDTLPCVLSNPAPWATTVVEWFNGKEDRNVILMCYCPKYHTCHRRTVLAYLQGWFHSVREFGKATPNYAHPLNKGAPTIDMTASSLFKERV